MQAFAIAAGARLAATARPSVPVCANDQRFRVREQRMERELALPHERHGVEQALLNRSERERELLIAHLAPANDRLSNLRPFGTAPMKFLKPRGKMVGVRGFEPPTPASRTQYSTRLSYTPRCYTRGRTPKNERGQ